MVYLLYIYLQIRKIPRKEPVIEVTDFDNLTNTRSISRDAAFSAALLFPRSIRFQDEEATDGPSGKPRSSTDSLELSALDGSEGFHADADGPHEDFSGESEPVQQSDKGRDARDSIYHHPCRRDRSDSLHSSQRHVSPVDDQRIRHRPSFWGSSTSLSRLLVGNSMTIPTIVMMCTRRSKRLRKAAVLRQACS